MKKFNKSGKSAVALVFAVAAAPVFAQTAATFDTSDAVVTIAAVGTAIGVIGLAWLGPSYIKKGWKMLKGG